MARAWFVFVAVAWPALALASEGEHALPPREAFAIGARTRVHDARELDVHDFNRVLRKARARKEEWASNFLLVATRFAGLPAQGRHQRIEIETFPTEWEIGREFDHVRVTIEDRDWLDDSARGERWIVWLVPSRESVGLEIARALHAQECQRSAEQWFYSAQPCP
jgi:hypothetical protein